MYDQKDKKKLYWLIDEYLLSKMNESTFCNEFYYSYDLAIDRGIFNRVEQHAFMELSKVVSRFSQYDEDHKIDVFAFSTVQELKQKIIETKELLQQQDPI